MRFYITGSPEMLNRFFEICHEIPLVAVSWPSKDEGRAGYMIQLSETLKNRVIILRALCTECNLRHTVEEKSELERCKEFLRFILYAAEKGHLTCAGMNIEQLRQLTK